MLDGDNVAVELAGLDDVAGVAAVHLATRRSAYAHLLPEAVLAGMTSERLRRWWEQRLVTAPRPHRLWVALTDTAGRHVLGFVHVGPAGDEFGELYAIHVHPRAQGLGLGVRLLAAGCDALREFGFRRARLWVLEGNQAARAFYRRHNWRLVEGLYRHDDIDSASVVEVAYERDLQPSC